MSADRSPMLLLLDMLRLTPAFPLGVMSCNCVGGTTSFSSCSSSESFRPLRVSTCFGRGPDSISVGQISYLLSEIVVFLRSSGKGVVPSLVKSTLSNSFLLGLPSGVWVCTGSWVSYLESLQPPFFPESLRYKTAITIMKTRSKKPRITNPTMKPFSLEVYSSFSSLETLVI